MLAASCSRACWSTRCRGWYGLPRIREIGISTAAAPAGLVWGIRAPRPRPRPVCLSECEGVIEDTRPPKWRPFLPRPGLGLRWADLRLGSWPVGARHGRGILRQATRTHQRPWNRAGTARWAVRSWAPRTVGRYEGRLS